MLERLLFLWLYYNPSTVIVIIIVVIIIFIVASSLIVIILIVILILTLSLLSLLPSIGVISRYEIKPRRQRSP